MAQNRADTALTLLERLLVQVEALGQMGRALEVLLLQSLALDDQAIHLARWLCSPGH